MGDSYKDIRKKREANKRYRDKHKEELKLLQHKHYADSIENKLVGEVLFIDG